jgi:hypothetical protein
MSKPKNYHTMTLKELVEHMSDRRNHKAVQNWCLAKNRRGELTPEAVNKIKAAVSAITIMKRIQKYNKVVNELESFDTVRFYAVDEMEYLLRTGYDAAQKSFRDEGM